MNRRLSGTDGGNLVASGIWSQTWELAFAKANGAEYRLCALMKGELMDAGDFLKMFRYDHWANREVLRAIQGGGAGSGATVGRIAHILGAEKLWLERMRGERQSMPVWPTSTVEECAALADEMGSAWRDYLTALAPDELGKKVQYRNSKGEAWSSRVEDVLMHVIMHSAYHRGQIAMAMRAAGMEPAYTDFIHAVRQGWVK